MGGKKYFFPEGVYVGSTGTNGISNFRVAQFVNSVPNAPEYFLIKSHRNLSQLGTCYTLAGKLGEDSLLLGDKMKIFTARGISDRRCRIVSYDSFRGLVFTAKLFRFVRS